MFKNIFERYALQVNNCLAPGMPSNKVAIFADGKFYCDEDTNEVEEYVNKFLFPWAFMNGVYCSGMTHGNFVVERSYKEVEEVVKSKEEDYSLNVDILNYVMGVMAAADAVRKGCKDIIMVSYCGEADYCYTASFKNEEEFTEGTKEDLEYFEEE